MTDPAQVVAEAPCLRPDVAGACLTMFDRVHPDCAVAALKAAGALMPVEAQTELRAQWRLFEERNRTDALLQEVREVLGRHRPKADDPTRCACQRGLSLTGCPEASLAERIEKVLGGEG